MFTASKWTAAEMSNALLFTMCIFNLLYYNYAFRTVDDMGWRDDPRTVWDRKDAFSHRLVLFVLNIRNYNNNNLEKTYIALGILLDNSRILTSYTPFKDLIHNYYYTDNLLVLIPVGGLNKTVDVKIANLVCGRQLMPLNDDLMNLWTNISIPHVPIHDLMIFRIEEEIGKSPHYSHSRPPYGDFKEDQVFNWPGPGDIGYNALTTAVNSMRDRGGDHIHVYGLGYRNKEEVHNNSFIVGTSSEDSFGMDEVEDDNDDYKDYRDRYRNPYRRTTTRKKPVKPEKPAYYYSESCNYWMPYEWGNFLCIRNLMKYMGISSGAMLFYGHIMIGVGAFALYRNESSVLVFTDLLFYRELIWNTCGNSEIKKDD